MLTDFQIEPVRVPEMEATLKISDNVFRHLIVRKPVLKPAPATGKAAPPPEPEAPSTAPEPATASAVEEPAPAEPEAGEEEE